MKDSDSICTNISDLNHYLDSHSELAIKDDILIYQFNDDISEKYKIEIETNKVAKSKERYYQIKLQSLDDSNRLESLFKILKSHLRRIQPKDSSISTIQNDAYRNNSIEAYPIIFETENSMRRVISKFMLFNLGSSWSKSAVAIEISNYIKKRKEDLEYGTDDIYGTDFKHLSEILFGKYRFKEISQLDNQLSKDKSEWTEINLEDYKLISNWERYFSEIIEYNPKKLEEQWQTLYEIRNKVAHNRGISSFELSKLKKTTTEINKVLKQASAKVDDLELSTKEAVVLGNQIEEIIAMYHLNENTKNPFHNEFKGFSMEWAKDNSAEWTAHLIGRNLAKRSYLKHNGDLDAFKKELQESERDFNRHIFSIAIEYFKKEEKRIIE